MKFHWMGRIVIVGLALATATIPALGQDPIRASVVKVLATTRPPDLIRPWTKGNAQEASGTGAVIEGNHILTCAHVVSYASQLYVQPFQSADKIRAKVVAMAPAIDLAILSVEDEAFFKDRPAIPFAEELPQMKEKVNAYGYPVGGSELSVTEGIISRVEFGALNAETQGLHIQVDAALNPGNSGGPAIAQGHIIGVVFSTMRDAENIGYLIAVEEIRQFLNDVKDGTYEGKPQIFDLFTQCENDALRAKLKLPPGEGGALVGEPYKAGEKHPLRKWDVITHIGEFAIGSDAKLPVRDDLRLYFEYMVPQVIKDGKVPLTIWRDGRSEKIEMAITAERDRVVTSLEGEYPRYVIFGPLVFSNATQEFVNGLVSRGAGAWLLSSRNSPLLTRRFAPREFEGEEIVVISSPMFPHAMTKSYDNPFPNVVSTVNGVKIKNLRHLAEVLRDVKDPFTVFEFADRGPQVLVFRTQEMRDATEEILTDNGIRYQCSDDLRDIFK